VSSSEASGSTSGEPRQRAARDWRARARETAIDSLRHTRFVGVMRRTLPVAASVLILAVLIYALMPRQSDKITMVYQRLGHIENDLTMMKPRLTGTDEKGDPFVITAERAIQDPRDPHRARLVNIEADITIENRQWINAMAGRGLIDVDTGALNVTDDISVFSDSGYELHTSRGNIDLHRGTFDGPRPVRGQGPLGNFSADRFEIDRARRMIFLNGNVRMTMYPAKAGAGK